jgi:hypothetical protein
MFYTQLHINSITLHSVIAIKVTLFVRSVFQKYLTRASPEDKALLSFHREKYSRTLRRNYVGYFPLSEIKLTYTTFRELVTHCTILIDNLLYFYFRISEDQDSSLWSIFSVLAWYKKGHRFDPNSHL